MGEQTPGPGCVVTTTEDETGQTILDVVWNWQPVQIMKQWGRMVDVWSHFRLSHQTRGCVQYCMESTRYTSEGDTVAIIIIIFV